MTDCPGLPHLLNGVLPAAKDGSGIGIEHVFHRAKREYEKIGKLWTEKDFGSRRQKAIMIGTREQEKQGQNSAAPAKVHHTEANLNLNTCGGCNSCHQMTRIHQAGSMTAWSVEGGEGPGLSKPCAVNFFQRNLGNSYLQSFAFGNAVPTVQRKCDCGDASETCECKEEEIGKIQAKLTIGQPDDIYEQEADRIADQVMRMPKDGSLDGGSKGYSENCVIVQRTSRDSEKNLCRQSREEEEKIEAKALSDPTAQVTHGVEAKINSLKGSGQPLPSSLRSFFEPRLSSDFTHVRIHTDSPAVEAARSVKARAFTLGSNIVFGEGQYMPNTTEGQRLLAHELTHVMQQDNSHRVKRMPEENEGEFIEGPPEQSIRIPKWIVEDIESSKEAPVIKEDITLARKPMISDLSHSIIPKDDSTIILRQPSGPATGNCSWTCPPVGALPYVPVSDTSFNCYAYSLNVSEWKEPGQITNTVEWRAHHNDINAINALGGYAAAREHLKKNYYTPNGMLKQTSADLGSRFSSNCIGCCTGSNRKIIMVTTDPLSVVGHGHFDFHFYRKDKDKGWSHKPGHTDSKREDSSGVGPICSPCRAGRDYGTYNYKNILGAWCISGGSVGEEHNLKSPRFAGDQTLEKCYDDEARLTKGAVGESVRKVQQALIDLGYNLGPTGADSKYGDFTWNAVKQFKVDYGLGYEWMGDVGPGTMSKLDELFASV